MSSGKSWLSCWSRLEAGERAALDQLMPLFYRKLRRLARLYDELQQGQAQ